MFKKFGILAAVLMVLGVGLVGLAQSAPDGSVDWPGPKSSPLHVPGVICEDYGPADRCSECYWSFLCCILCGGYCEGALVGHLFWCWEEGTPPSWGWYECGPQEDIGCLCAACALK